MTKKLMNPKTRIKFSKEQAKLLREAYSAPDRPDYMSYRFLAKLHNVDKTTIWRILKNLTHVEY